MSEPSPTLADLVADEEVARLFHETYERLAPDFGYRTRVASAVPWADVPPGNKALMVAVAGVVRAALAAPDPGPLPVDWLGQDILDSLLTSVAYLMEENGASVIDIADLHAAARMERAEWASRAALAESPARPEPDEEPTGAALIPAGEPCPICGPEGHGQHVDDSYGSCVTCRTFVAHTDDVMQTVPFPCAPALLAESPARSREEPGLDRRTGPIDRRDGPGYDLPNLHERRSEHRRKGDYERRVLHGDRLASRG